MRPPDRMPRLSWSLLIGGAILVLAIFAFDEYGGLAERLLGGAERRFARHSEFAIEAAAALLVTGLAAALYRRLSTHERRLSELLTVCAWCRRVSVDGRWVTIEEFLHRHEGSRTTVSLCATCYERVHARSGTAAS